MKKLLLTTAALAASIGSAFAADLPSVKAPPVVALPPPAWTGFYVGVHGEWAGNVVDITTTTVTPGTFLTSTVGNSFSGPTVGGQFGYSYEFANRFVLGGQFDMDWADVSWRNGTSYSAAAGGGFGVGGAAVANARTSLDWLGGARLRLGYDFGKFLPFVTGGVAFGGLSSTNNASSVVTGFGVSATYGSASKTSAGWAVGAGFEYMLTESWSIYAEYLYASLDGITRNDATIGFAPAASTLSIKYLDLHQARGGVNYHFNWATPAPVFAKF
jgi:outer membrane immunogenic protein